MSTRKAFSLICACIACCLLIDLIHKLFYEKHIGSTNLQFKFVLGFAIASYALYKEK